MLFSGWIVLFFWLGVIRYRAKKDAMTNNNDATDDTVSTGIKDSIWSKRKMQTYDPTNGHGSYDPTGTFVMKLPGAGLEPGRRWI